MDHPNSTMKENKKMSLGALIGITVAFFASVRPVPQVAGAGWTQIAYMMIAAVFFALPVALMSAELSTTYPEKGGSQVWISRALGEKWSFVSTVLLMLMMMVAMVMILTSVSALVGEIIGNDMLGENNILSFFIVIGVFWLLTLLSLKVNVLKYTSIGAAIGVYIPFAVLTLLSIAYLVKNGIRADSLLTSFAPSKLFPDFAHPQTISTLAAVVFIFAGVEMSSVHVNEIDNPTKNYPIGVCIAVLGVTLISILAGLGTANANTEVGIRPDNVVDTFRIMVEDLGLPGILINLMALCILLGILAQVSSWILGPCQSLLAIAKSGMLPKALQVTDHNDNPSGIILMQAIGVTVFALPLLLFKDVNEVFNVLTTTSTLFYCLIYVMISISAIRLRYQDANAVRPFRIGNKGNAFMWCCAGIVLFINLATILIGLLMPPAHVTPEEVTGYRIIQIVATSLAVALPLLVYRFRKPQWKNIPGSEKK